MARNFVRESSQYIEADAAPVTAYPLAMACWFNSDSDATEQVLMFVGDKDVSNHWFALLLFGQVAGDPVAASVRAGSSTSTADTTTGYSANTWHLAAGIYISATDRRAYIDGGSEGTNTTSRSPTGLDRISIGRHGDSSPGDYMSGMVAEAAVWDLSVYPGATDTDKATAWKNSVLPALAKGFSPDHFMLGLVFYRSFIREFNGGYGGTIGATLTNNGTTVSNHPRIIYPRPIRRPWLRTVIAAPAGAIMTPNRGFWGGV